MNNNSRLNTLHYLRGLAALFVVAFHFRGYLNNVYSQSDLGNLLFSGGTVGVDVFFMISGFIIVFATKKKQPKIKMFVDFVLRRFFRVYPLLWFCLFVGFLTIYKHYDFIDMFRSLIPLHENYNKSPPTFEYNLMGPAWTLTYEIYFYFLFSISMMVNHKFRSFICSGLIFFQVLFIQYLFDGEVSFSALNTLNGHNDFLNFLSNTMLFEFIVGMMFYELFYSNRLSEFIQSNKLLLSRLSYLFLGVFIVLFSARYNNSFGPQGLGGWALFLFAYVVINDKFNKVKDIRFLSFLGDISYALYISHYIVRDSISKYHLLLWEHTSGFSRFIFVFSVSLLIAIFLHFTIEKPCVRLGKRLVSK